MLRESQECHVFYFISPFIRLEVVSALWCWLGLIGPLRGTTRQSNINSGIRSTEGNQRYTSARLSNHLLFSLFPTQSVIPSFQRSLAILSVFGLKPHSEQSAFPQVGLSFSRSFAQLAQESFRFSRSNGGPKLQYLFSPRGAECF